MIDSGEQHPFTFKGLHGDSADNYRPLEVPTERKYLGPSMGDYSIALSTSGNTPDEFHIGRVSVERKSREDAHGTFLGWGPRRERFERELFALANMDMAAIVIECNMDDLLRWAPAYGEKTAAQNAKSLHRIIISWQTTFPVPWFFCGTRRFAEITTFRFLDRYYRKKVKGEK